MTTDISKPKDGGPAFPLNPEINFDYKGNVYPEAMGMTLREFYAGQALPAVIAEMGKVQGIGSETFWSRVSIHATRAADALIKALEEDHDH